MLGFTLDFAALQRGEPHKSSITLHNSLLAASQPINLRTRSIPRFQIEFCDENGGSRPITKATAKKALDAPWRKLRINRKSQNEPNLGWISNKLRK